MKPIFENMHGMHVQLKEIFTEFSKALPNSLIKVSLREVKQGV